jgi:putative transposase
MDKFLNKYRIESTRLKNWDYANNSAYFVTICTKNRINYFGEIQNDKMILSEIGKIVEAEWIKTPEIRPDMNLKLDSFIVMPDHFHGIIIIGENEFNSKSYRNKIKNYEQKYECRDALTCVSDEVVEKNKRDAKHCVSSNRIAYKNEFVPQSKNLGSIIRGFKIAITVQARKIDPSFSWQSRFYDHIIGDDISLFQIKEYIENNPLNWGKEEIYE